MIRAEHFPSSIPFFDNGRIQLSDSDRITLPDVLQELRAAQVYGFKIFDMMADESVDSSYGFLYYPQTLDGELVQEIGNLIMSQIASNFDDQFLTPPKSLKTLDSLEILRQQEIQHLRQISFTQDEKSHRLTLCIFKGKSSGASGNA